MMGWMSNEAPGVFWATPIDAATDRLAALIREHRPDVVVTYDETGFYGHPDHIQAHRITMAAVDALAPEDAPAKVYWSTMPHTAIREFGRRIREFGADWDEATDDEPKLGLPDDQITTWVDTVAFADRKYRALEVHASQPDNAFFLKLGLPMFTELFGVETFLRVRDFTGRPPTRETDLFAGLR